MADEFALSALSKAIGDIESGGHDDPYSAEGPPAASGDRAYGKYQVMGNNIPSWTEEAGLGRMSPMQFKANPDAQEKVFRTRMGKYLDDHNGSVRDAASMWHAGVPYDRAAAEGRIDHAGTKTVDYADHIEKAVGGDGVSQTTTPPPASDVPAVSPKTVLSDPRFWQLGDDDRLGVMRKIDPRFAALSAEDQQGVLAASDPRPKTPAAASTSTPATNVEHPAWYSGLADEAGEKFATAVSNALESGKSLMQKPESGAQVLRDLFGLLEPWTVTSDISGVASERAAKASGAGPLGQKVARVAGETVGAIATPAPPGFGIASKLLGKGVSKVLGRGEELLPEAVSAARAEAPEAAAAAERVGATATPPSEAAAASRDVLAPSGATTETVGGAAKTALKERAKTFETMAGGVYDSAIENAQAEGKVLDPARYQSLDAHLKDVRKTLGAQLSPEADNAITNLESRIAGGQPVRPNDLAAYKYAVDTTFPGKMKAGTEVRDALRSMFSSEDRSWAEAADAMWRDELRGQGMTESSLGAIVKLAKKSDPSAVVEKLFGGGDRVLSDRQGAIGRSVLKHLESEDPKLAGEVKDALFDRAVNRATSSDGTFNPRALVNEFDKLKPLHSAIASPEKKAFFDVLRNQLEKGEAAPGKLARITAEGIVIAAGHKVGAAVGHPFLGVMMAHRIIPPGMIAKKLSDPKVARALTRAMQTPANSAIAPTIIKQLNLTDTPEPSDAAA